MTKKILPSRGSIMDLSEDDVPTDEMIDETTKKVAQLEKVVAEAKKER
mgnify:CR=1 FL=1